MSAKQNVIEQALKLSETERLEIAEALYESVDGAADPGAQEAWDAEIKRRLNELDSGKVKSIPWAEARRRIAGDEHGSAGH